MSIHYFLFLSIKDNNLCCDFEIVQFSEVNLRKKGHHWTIKVVEHVFIKEELATSISYIIVNIITLTSIETSLLTH